MASIDPDEETEGAPRATLRMIHDVLDIMEDDSEEDSDDEDDIAALERRLGLDEGESDEEDNMDLEDDDSEEEGVNGGPSDPEARLKLAKEVNGEDESSDDEQEASNGINGVNGALNKGKGPALNQDLEGLQEYIVCTLDRNQVSPHVFRTTHFLMSSVRLIKCL